jgi:hypothetical protein
MTAIKIALGIVAVVTALAIIAAPTLVAQRVFAAPPPPTTTCTQRGAGDIGSTCPGSSGGTNPNREQTCTAKNAGLQKKECP